MKPVKKVEKKMQCKNMTAVTFQTVQLQDREKNK